MADESMEFANDLGHDHDADDYLDLDIDFTTGQPEDEDFMVEDVAPTQELGDEHMHSPRQSPHHVAVDDIMQSPHHTGGDDLMLDDEENEDHIFDQEILDDEHQHHMEDEAPSHSFVTVNETYNDYSEHPETTVTAGGDIDELTDLNWEPDEDVDYVETGGQDKESFQHGELDETNVHHHENEAEQHGEVDESKVHHYENEIVEEAKTASNRDSHTTSPPQGSEEQLDVEEPGSPSASNQEYQAVSRHGSPDSFSQKQDQYEETQEETTQPHAPAERTSSRAYKGITVVYRDLEYSLFGTAVDDSDSYFLSDLSLAEKPISEFFKEIRNVLSFEILEQEELCVSVKHLGLDIEEISCPLHDVTIAQILDLHKKFLINDEIMVHPLCMHLWTRISFTKRFEYLAAAAADGKSLSELDVLDKDSVQYNNSGEASEDPEDHGVAVEEETIDEDLRPRVAPTDAHAKEDEEDRYTIEQADEPQQEEHATGEDQYYQENENGVDDTTPTNPAYEAEGEGTNGVQEGTQIHIVERVDEEGDLIDYSDDDLDTTVPQADKAQPKTTTTEFSKICVLPDNCVCTKCAALFVEGFEVVNEDLRRRSLSRSAEHHAQGATPEISQNVYTENTFEVEIENDEAESNVDDWDGAEEEETYEYAEVGNADEHAGAEEEIYEYTEDDNADEHAALDNQDNLDLSAGVDQGDDIPINGASTGLDEFAEVEDIFDDNQQYLVHVEEEEEIDLTPPSEVPEINPSENAATVDWTNGTKSASDAGLSHPQTDASSSATASLNAQTKDELTDDDFMVDEEADLEISRGDTKAAIEVAGDEIDYDENDYAEGLSTPSKDEHPNPLEASNGSGKRPWQDLDDASVELNNDVKRIRS